MCRTSVKYLCAGSVWYLCAYVLFMFPSSPASSNLTPIARKFMRRLIAKVSARTHN